MACISKGAASVVSCMGLVQPKRVADHPYTTNLSSFYTRMLQRGSECSHTMQTWFGFLSKLSQKPICYQLSLGKVVQIEISIFLNQKIEWHHCHQVNFNVGSIQSQRLLTQHTVSCKVCNFCAILACHKACQQEIEHQSVLCIYPYCCIFCLIFLHLIIEYQYHSVFCLLVLTWFHALDYLKWLQISE